MFKGEHGLEHFRKTTVHLAKQLTTWLNRYKFHLLKGVGLTALLSVLVVVTAWAASHYVEVNTNEVFHVYMNDQQVGTVSSPDIVEKFILYKVRKLEEQYPDVNMVLNSHEISYVPETDFKLESDDESALLAVDEQLVPEFVGVEIRVDNQLIGIVKDQETADDILQQLLGKYIPEPSAKGQVSILSFNASEEEEEPQPGQVELEAAEFVEEVDTSLVDIDPDELTDPLEILEKLETGDVQPTKYVVQAGDCINCIARQFNISPQTIYENNHLEEMDILQIGDVLDLTESKPALSVRTVEKVKSMIDVHYDTEYEYDDTLRIGRSVTLREGVPGKKLQTKLITKINGFWDAEELVDEEIIVSPIAALVRKGTMVIKGEGTGTFARPVKNAKTSSSYGQRWGRLHAGIDFTSRNKDILAADNGTVEKAGWHSGGYGNYVIIDHKNGFKTLYAHLSKINTTKGAIVEKGEKIGTMGNTGNSTGTHLHFEIRKNGKAVNPASYLK